jgi:hypothetical protein
VSKRRIREAFLCGEGKIHVNQNELASRIILALGTVARDLPSVIKRELLARLMVAIGVGMPDPDVGWSRILREIFELQFESPGRTQGTKPIMDWVLRTELGLLSRICGLIPVQVGAPTCDKGLFP